MADSQHHDTDAAARRHALIIEDDVAHARLLEHFLRRAKPRPFTASSVHRLADGLNRLQEGGFDVVVLDLSLPDSIGLKTFDAVHQAFPDLPAIVMTGNDNEQLALEAVKRGAQDYIVKRQSSNEVIVRAVNYAIEHQRLKSKLQQLRETARSGDWLAVGRLLETIESGVRTALEGLPDSEPGARALTSVLTAATEAIELAGPPQ